jgi:hypothetical protein
VAYQFSAPTPALAFNRTPDDSRTRDWRPTNPAFQVVMAPETGAEVIRRRDGALFTAVELLMDARFSMPPKDYAPFMPFHDGGLLIHTGRLQACAIVCDDAATQAGFLITITPPDGSLAVVDGRSLATTASFVDAGSGRMVYVGAAAPSATAYAATMLDPALPGAFRERLEDQLPRLMAVFEGELGALAATPELYASLDPTVQPDNNPDSNRFSMNGGVLPGQIFMHLVGDGWAEDPALWGAFGEGVGWFFAHEAAHLFQQLDGVDPSPQDTWIHEGGADALAAVAALQLGVVSQTYVHTRIREAAAICIDGLRAGPLQDASARGAFDMHYACGMLLQLAAHQEAQATGNDLYAVWRRFLDSVRDGAAWDAHGFEAAMRETGAPSAAALAQRVLSRDDGLTAVTLIEAASPSAETE